VWLADLASPEVTLAMWHLYRAGAQAVGERVRALQASQSELVRWRAALILAACGESVAEERLLAAIAALEEAGAERSEPPAASADPKAPHIKVSGISVVQPGAQKVPRWWAAAAFLRYCGTPTALPSLAQLARQPGLQLNARTSIALSMGGVAARHHLDDHARGLVTETLELLSRTTAADSRTFLLRDVVSGKPGERMREAVDRLGVLVEEDFTWQVHFAVARARLALGLPAQSDVARFAVDRRALVRSAFTRLSPPAPRPSSP
jgi:hypothetical protein